MISQQKQYTFFILLLLFLVVSCNKRSSIKQQLEQQNKIENTYHFYPSTLRMLNIRNVESFDKLVKDVEKLTFLNLRADSFSYEKNTGLITYPSGGRQLRSITGNGK